MSLGGGSEGEKRGRRLRDNGEGPLASVRTAPPTPSCEYHGPFQVATFLPWTDPGASYGSGFCFLNSSMWECCILSLESSRALAATPDNERSGARPPASVGALQPPAQTIGRTATQFSDGRKAAIKRRVTQWIWDHPAEPQPVSIERESWVRGSGARSPTRLVSAPFLGKASATVSIRR